jgi:hypothetical protein
MTGAANLIRDIHNAMRALHRSRSETVHWLFHQSCAELATMAEITKATLAQ